MKLQTDNIKRNQWQRLQEKTRKSVLGPIMLRLNRKLTFQSFRFRIFEGGYPAARRPDRQKYFRHSGSEIPLR